MFKSKDITNCDRNDLLESIKLIATDYNKAKLEIEKLISFWELLTLENCSSGDYVDCFEIDLKFRKGISFQDYINLYHNMIDSLEVHEAKFSKIAYFTPRIKRFEKNQYQIYFNLINKSISFEKEAGLKLMEISVYRNHKGKYNSLAKIIKETTNSELVKEQLIKDLQKSSMKLYNKVLKHELNKSFEVEEISDRESLEWFKLALESNDLKEAKRIFKSTTSYFSKKDMMNFILEYFEK